MEPGFSVLGGVLQLDLFIGSLVLFSFSIGVFGVHHSLGFRSLVSARMRRIPICNPCIDTRSSMGYDDVGF